MNFAFRVDASLEIGTGHLMRCLALADSLRKVREIRGRFVFRQMPDHLSALIRNLGYEAICIDTSPVKSSYEDEFQHSKWLGVTQRQDAQDTLSALADRHWDWIVVDHYALGKVWEGKISAITNKVMVIDDIADRVHDCDILLDQNFYSDMYERYVGKVPARCQLLLGPKYALLREEFLTLRNKVPVKRGAVTRILVFLGGADSKNYTRLVLSALARVRLGKIKVDVVIGQQHPARAEIEIACSQCGFSCHVQTNDMALLMINADMAIGAGGSAIWERCISGLPSILLVVADNQAKAVADLADAGIVFSAGDAKIKRPEELARDISMFLENEDLRISLSSKSIALMASHDKTLAEILTEHA